MSSKDKEREIPEEEELNKLPALQVPTFHPTSFSLAALSNVVVITCNEPQVMVRDFSPLDVLRVEPSVVLKLSPQSLKDLALGLASLIQQYEEVYGVIRTDLMAGNKNERK